MAFKKSGSEKHSKIEVIKPTPLNKIQANESNITCKYCNSIIGKKVGSIYKVLDKQYVSMNGIKCPKCGR